MCVGVYLTALCVCWSISDCAACVLEYIWLKEHLTIFDWIGDTKLWLYLTEWALNFEEFAESNRLRGRLWGGYEYGVATISRLLKIIDLFCRISSLLWGSFAKETYNFKAPTSHSHPPHKTCDSTYCDVWQVCALTVRRADKQLHLHLVRQAAVMD